MSKKNIILAAVLLFGTTSSFAARPLGTDDYATLARGKSGFELGYDNNKTLAFAVKHAPIESLELSAEYSLPSGTGLMLDQVVINAKYTIPGKSVVLELDQAIKVKYDAVAKTLGLTGIVSYRSNQYNIHTNISYIPNTPVTFLIAGEWETLEPFEPVVEVTFSGSNINGLVGLRYEVKEGNILDVATIFPISGSGASSSFIGFSAEF